MWADEDKGSSLSANLALRHFPRYKHPAPLPSNANNFIPFNSMLKNSCGFMLPMGLLTINDFGANTWHFATSGMSSEVLAAASDCSQLPLIFTFIEGVVQFVDGGESTPLFPPPIRFLPLRCTSCTSSWWHLACHNFCTHRKHGLCSLRRCISSCFSLGGITCTVTGSDGWESIFTWLAARPLLWLRRSGRLLKVFLESALSARPGRFWAASCGVVDTGATSIDATSSRGVSRRLNGSISTTFSKRWVFGGTYAEDGNDDTASDGGGL